MEILWFVIQMVVYGLIVGLIIGLGAWGYAFIMIHIEKGWLLKTGRKTSSNTFSPIGKASGKGCVGS